MGKGLGIQKAGTHIAFSAGTGCLVFLDLVAHLIKKNLNMLDYVANSHLDNENFKFVFFVSFQKKEESIGLDLCEGLKLLNSKLGKASFELNVRFSNESKSRWDSEFIEKELTKHMGKISKVWVCGPPKMNEDFDKVLEKLAPQLQIGKDQYEIM